MTRRRDSKSRRPPVSATYRRGLPPTRDKHQPASPPTARVDRCRGTSVALQRPARRPSGAQPRMGSSIIGHCLIHKNERVWVLPAREQADRLVTCARTARSRLLCSRFRRRGRCRAEPAPAFSPAAEAGAGSLPPGGTVIFPATGKIIHTALSTQGDPTSANGESGLIPIHPGTAPNCHAEASLRSERTKSSVAQRRGDVAQALCPGPAQFQRQRRPATGASLYAV